MNSACKVNEKRNDYYHLIIFNKMYKREEMLLLEESVGQSLISQEKSTKENYEVDE